MDPYDVEALEKSVNDSAGRVATIWVAFILFGLYLVIAAGGITHNALFLNEPVKLPALSVDLPVDRFFLVAPVLFVIFHIYLLVQIILLSHTAVAYNEAVEHSITEASDRARVRQRLVNTLFAQIFAGSPREREGMLGALLRLMAWATLVIGPVVVLLIYQVTFLPYQSAYATWTHRVLIVVDLVMILVLLGKALAFQRIGWRIRAKKAVLSGAIFLLLIVELDQVHFPGEPHVNWLPWLRPQDDECGDPERRFFPKWLTLLLPLFHDRLVLPRVDVVDDERLAKIEREEKVNGMRPHEGERTRDFSNRNLRCGNFYRADFRRANFIEADLRGADLAFAQLQGALLSGANLENAGLRGAQMQGANLSTLRSQVEIYRPAQLSGARLWDAQLQGALLTSAEMRGANLTRAQMQGARLTATDLRGADLSNASMRAADLRHANLRGAVLSGTEMQGADLEEAYLEGTNLDKSFLTLGSGKHILGRRRVQIATTRMSLSRASISRINLRRGLMEKRNSSRVW
jgi:uncharacterized protein YjbI with pentapeptide repeats